MRGINVSDVLNTVVQDGETRVNLGNAVSGTGEAAEAGIWCTANVISVPEAPNADGACQAIYMRDGETVRVIGYRDNRNAAKAGNLVGGDFAIVNSGNARFLMKRENESITLYTETANHSIMVDVNAKEDHVLIVCGASFIQMTNDKIVLSAGGASLELSEASITAIADYIGLNSGKGNLGLIAGAPPPPGANSVIFGVSGVAGSPSANWTVAP